MERFTKIARIFSLTAAVCLSIGPVWAQNSLVITSPASGTVVTPGSTLTVTVDVRGPYNAVMVAGPAPINLSQFLTASPYTFSLAIPADSPAQTYTLNAVGFYGQGQQDESPAITIDVERPDSPANLTVEPGTLVLTRPGESADLWIRGEFADGVRLTVTNSSKTTYTSNETSIATVDGFGWVTAVGPGITGITVKNGDTETNVGIIVLNPVTLGPPRAVLYAGQRQRFHANVMGIGGDPTVTWSVAPDGAGSIDGNGVFTAPSPIVTMQVATVTATMAATGLSNSARVWLYPPLSLNVVPNSINRGPSESVAFVAAAINPPSVAVQWSMTPAGLGTLDSSGNYTAPDTIASTQTVTVSARTMTNPPITATATVTLNPAVEFITTPDPPVGPSSGASGILYQYSATGGVSSAGSTIQYSFNWGDGSYSGWTPPSVTSSFHTWANPGTYLVRVVASSVADPSIASSPSEALVVTIGGEAISAPQAPSGPADVVTGTSYTYSTGGSVSSLGHAVQYRLFWGDGSYSPWLPVGVTSSSHTWMGAGNFTVTAKARCAADTQVFSAASADVPLTVAPGETIAAPNPPVGPLAGSAGTSYTYTASGGNSSAGNPLVYLFDWGDGRTSGWLAAGRTTASHKWTTPGTYTVTVYAADAGNLLMHSPASDGLTVTIQ